MAQAFHFTTGVVCALTPGPSPKGRGGQESENEWVGRTPTHSFSEGRRITGDGEAVGDINRPEMAAINQRGSEKQMRAPTVVTASRPPLDPGPPLPSLAGPRLLSLGELERVRDALAGRIGTLRARSGRAPRPWSRE